jgi:hypothetical protein
MEPQQFDIMNKCSQLLYIENYTVNQVAIKTVGTR